MLVNLIVWIIIGGLAGWLAGVVMKSEGGLVTNIIVGIIGGFLGGFIFDVLGIGGEVDGLNLGSLFVAFVGAVVLIALLRFLRR